MTKFYMHTTSGDVATEQEWRDDFDGMDIESWFGLPADECEGLHWIEDNIDSQTGQKILIEVEKDTDGEWVEV